MRRASDIVLTAARGLLGTRTSEACCAFTASHALGRHCTSGARLEPDRRAWIIGAREPSLSCNSQCITYRRYISFHNFEVFSGLSHAKIDPTIRKNENKQAALSDLLFAASEGDVAALILQAVSGVDVFASDYDSRTPLHLAARTRAAR